MYPSLWSTAMHGLATLKMLPTPLQVEAIFSQRVKSSRTSRSMALEEKLLLLHMF